MIDQKQKSEAHGQFQQERQCGAQKYNNCGLCPLALYCKTQNIFKLFTLSLFGYVQVTEYRRQPMSALGRTWAVLNTARLPSVPAPSSKGARVNSCSLKDWASAFHSGAGKTLLYTNSYLQCLSSQHFKCYYFSVTVRNIFFLSVLSFMEV